IYQSESAMAKPASSREMVATVARELDKIAARIKPDVLAVTDASGRTVAVSGRLAAGWPAALPGADGDATAPRLLLLPAGGVWLARTLARPINTLARSLADMSQVRAFDSPLAKCGSSREIDSLTGAFNDMMAALRAAEEETQSAYVGTIRALAMTLDARDRYTAGHSERVTALSVAVGQHMALDEDQIEVLRLGALLHD